MLTSGAPGLPRDCHRETSSYRTHYSSSFSAPSPSFCFFLSSKGICVFHVAGISMDPVLQCACWLCVGLGQAIARERTVACCLMNLVIPCTVRSSSISTCHMETL